MHEHQLAGEAGRRAPSWYLARGDKRYGPLGDRELLLLAERGSLQTEDLLWRPGFTSWKSVQAVCGVNPANAKPLLGSGSSQDGEYLLTKEGSDKRAETAEATQVKALEHCSADELQVAIYSGMLHNAQRDESELILREREWAPDQKLARRLNNNTAWTLAFSVGTFMVALAIFWLVATGDRLP
jgi:hypothetical protein